ncbi:hypothetical protein DC74_2 [Streptomyces noursei]|uniref:Uncharacterized protein n=1 Tax=Streptomyces noursei TaxID=1971 RepID=A0A059VT34_STRNR|nr:hypothetical protein DC74_2 [Streptomyces noursei]GCB88132.1 hypothetical protein SALB_00801 [Streptomyces noursei]
MRDSRPDRPVERVERRHQDPLASRSPGAQSPLWHRSQTDPVERGRSGPRAGATGRLPAVERVERGSAPVDWIDRFPLVSIGSLIGGRSTLIGRARRSGADRRWCPRRPGPPPGHGSLCARVCTPFARDPQLSAGAGLLGSAREASGRRRVPGSARPLVRRERRHGGAGGPAARMGVRARAPGARAGAPGARTHAQRAGRAARAGRVGRLRHDGPGPAPQTRCPQGHCVAVRCPNEARLTRRGDQSETRGRETGTQTPWWG